MNDYTSYNIEELGYTSYYEDEAMFTIEEAKGKWYIND